MFETQNTASTCKFSHLSKGFSDWQHLNPRLSEHENSVAHRQSYIQWKDLEKGLNEEKTIDANMQKAINVEKARWRHILKVMVDVIMFCAKNNLALRGCWSEDEPEAIGEKNSGILLNTLELISHYDLLIILQE